VTAEHVAHYDVIAGDDVGDIAAYGFDHSSTFMAKDRGERHREQLVPHHHVGVAYAAGNHADEYFVIARLADRDIFHEHFAALFANDGCLNDAAIPNSQGLISHISVLGPIAKSERKAAHSNSARCKSLCHKV
jgi:hypothetical protein